MGREAAVRVRHATGANALLVRTMNVLQMIRTKQRREEALKAAQKQLCYRGVQYSRQDLAKLC